MKNVLFVFVGGGLGSITRYLFALALNNKTIHLPYGTLLANVLGCLLIGLLMGLHIKSNNSYESLQFLAVVGFCGGFTTMATFSAESVQYLAQGKYQHFTMYMLLTIIACLGATLMGLWLVKT